MANVIESSQFDVGVYQIETEDPVLGGPDGIANKQAKNLANRTKYLKDQLEDKTGDATTTKKGIVELATNAEVLTGTDTVRAVTPAGVAAKIAALVNSSPAALDTLNELATALGNDPNFATTINNAIAAKAPTNSPALTGTPTAPTPPITDVSDRIATMAALAAAVKAADIIARFTTTANITLSGLGTAAGRDWGSALTAGDIILVKNQSTASQNGWYVASAGAWARVSYLDDATEVKASNITKVSEGVTLADSIWMLTTNAPLVIGTTGLAFAQKDGATLGSNTFSGEQNIDVNSASPALSIEQNGTGDALSVNGKVTVGTSPISGATIRVGDEGEGTTRQGVRVDPTLLADLTGTYEAYFTNVALQAATFTLGTLNHFSARQNSIGAGASITNQVGFKVSSTFVGATNNYGFYGDIPSGTNRWNMYMGGTANNYMAGNLGIGITTPTDRLHVLEASVGRAINIGSSDGNDAGWIGTTGEAGANNGLVVYASRGAGKFIIKTSSTNAAIFDSSGNNVKNINASAAALSVNNQTVDELTTNTKITTKVRGTDGTTRSIAKTNLIEAADDPTFANNSERTPSTSWVNGLIDSLFTKSLTSSGYQKLPGGLILQWGFSSTNITTEGTTLVTFPIVFPNACLFVTGVSRNTAESTNQNSFLQDVSLTASQWAFFNQAAPSSPSFTTNGYRYLAIGY